MYKLGVSFILKRAPRNTSGGDFIRACKNSEGGVVARGGEHSSIQLPGVLKRSRPPGHCLHCLHKLWLKFGTLLMCSWEGIIHQGLVLSLPLASRVPSISPLWLVKLIGTTVQQHPYHVLLRFTFIYPPSVNVPQLLLRPSALSPYAQGPWPSGSSPASLGSWLGPPGPSSESAAAHIGVPQKCCILYQTLSWAENILYDNNM